LLFVAGEPLTLEEAYTHLETLVSPNEEIIETQPSLSQRSISFNFNFLPEVTISFTLETLRK